VSRLAIARAVIAASMLVALTMPSVRLAGDRLGIRRFRTPPITSTVHLSQTFQMSADGLEAVEIRPTQSGPSVSGIIVLSMTEIGAGGERQIASARVQAADLVRQRRYRFAFERVPRSRSRVYRLDLASSDASPADGVGVWATRGERYDRGAMLINGVERWADIAFEAKAPAPPVWRALFAAGPLGVRGVIVMSALATTCLALAALLIRLGQ
jgi:hypothetical protein